MDTMYFSCFCKKRYQKKQTTLPVDRFVSCVQTETQAAFAPRT